MDKIDDHNSCVYNGGPEPCQFIQNKIMTLSTVDTRLWANIYQANLKAGVGSRCALYLKVLQAVRDAFTEFQFGLDGEDQVIDGDIDDDTQDGLLDTVIERREMRSKARTLLFIRHD